MGTENRTRRFLRLIVIAIGLQLLIGFSVSAVQAITLLLRMHATSISGREAIAITLFGIPFNTGGFTVRVVFEALVGPLEFLVGHRSMTVLSNLWFYVFLLALQMSIIALVVALGSGRTKLLRKGLFVVMASLLLANGLVNIMWPWWGT